MLIGVYGTLREGFGNHEYFLKGKKCIGTTKVLGLRMYSLGWYPCVVFTGKDEDQTVMEIYDLDEEKDKHIIEGMNHMEFGAGYVLKEITTELGKIKYYAFEDIPEDCDVIISGDWYRYSI